VARRREFDHDVVLDRAMTVFWAKGYEATSIEALVARTGIQRGSLYGAFGSKQRLFLAALDRYERVLVGELFEALEAPASGVEAVRRFFRLRIERSLERRRPLGCLVTNSAVELFRRDPAATTRIGGSLAQLERAFHRALERAREAGELDATRDLRALARFLTSSAQGLSVIAKVAPERSVLEDIVAVVLSVLEPGPAARPPRRLADAGSRAPGMRSPAGRPPRGGTP
jgi:TetR/AcrR family transcriptional repressor of nem operon